MRFFGGFGGWLRVSVRYSARGWRNGQGQRQSPHRRRVFCRLAERLTVKSRTSKGLENNSLLYPPVVNNLVAAAMNQELMEEPCRQHPHVQIWQYDLERNLYVFINRRKTTVCCFYP